MKQNKLGDGMKFIGITGGVGAGKSKILHYIEQEYPEKVLYEDDRPSGGQTRDTADC